MGIWDALQSTTDYLQQVSPDLAPVKDACRSAYGLGWAAAGAGSAAVSGKAVQAKELLHSAADKLPLSAPDLAPVAAAVSRMDHAVRVDGVQRVKEAVPDRDGWERIGRIAWDLSDYALGEVTKPYTGGLPAYKIVKEGWTKDQSRSAPAVVYGKERELLEMRNRIERMEKEMKLMKEGSGPPPYSHRTTVVSGVQKPEDVLRVFMMKGCFRGADFIEAQVVPRPER